MMEDVFATDTNELCLPVLIYLCLVSHRISRTLSDIRCQVTVDAIYYHCCIVGLVAMFIFVHETPCKATVVIYCMSDCYSCGSRHWESSSSLAIRISLLGTAEHHLYHHHDFMSPS